MRFGRLHTLQTMLDVGVVPTFTPVDLPAAKRVVSACSDAGAPVIEVMNRGEGTLAVFRDLVIWAKAEVPDVVLGAGTIYDAPTAAMFVDAGANFVVSPILNPSLARFCNRRRVPYLPGCGTATEISDAESLGAEIIKLFPAAAIDGAAFIKGILGPSPMSRIMPTNVLATAEATRKWFEAGAACLGIGAHLLSRDLQSDPNPSALAEAVLTYMGWVQAARSSMTRVE
jgi:2-dehydro-3-deoxyphosphogluconate aldolase / (4S)-4-hydroxy-2-oxoglutarate aldolase